MFNHSCTVHRTADAAGVARFAKVRSASWLAASALSTTPVCITRINMFEPYANHRPSGAPPG